MKSQTVIMILCWIALILEWTTEVMPSPDISSAMIWAWLIMWGFGFFKREEASLEAPTDERSQRQIDFMNKLEAGRNKTFNTDDEDDEVLSAKIVATDEDGNISTVTIKPDGTVETEGNPDPDIVEAASMLKDAIKKHGPEAIAQELGKQIDAIKRGKK